MGLEQVGYNAARIKEIIDMYDRLYPTGVDSIYASIEDAKVEQQELRLSKAVDRNGVINKSEVNRRLSFTMPSHLYIILKKQYPSIFKQDFKSFKRDFPVFFKAWQ